MTLQQLEYILAVNQFRHFAKAAEYCRVTQPTLSAMIQKLEEELDTKIFDRSQQPVCPTPIGLHIIEQARNVLVQTHRIKNIIEEEKHSLSGIFKLGILPTIAPYLLPRFFPQLMKKYPQLDIRVVEMKTNDIKKALQTGDIDAGIVAGLAGMEEFRQIPLFYEQFYTYIARENRLFSNEVIRTSDLTGEQLWLLDEGHCFRDQLERFCQLKAARASPVGLPSGQHGNLYAHGRKRQGHHFHSRTGCPATERHAERTGTSFCHPLSYPANHHADQPEFYPQHAFKYNRPRGNSGSAQRNALPESHSGTRIDFVYRPIKPFNRIFCSTGEKCYIFANRKSKDRLHLGIIRQACFCIRSAQSLHR